MAKWILLLLAIPLISSASILEPTIPQQIARWAADANLNIDLVLAVAKCESGYNPKAVSKTKDVGVMQINLKYHLAESKRLGYNIYDPIGNIRYGIYLIQTDGARRHYSASRHCWFPKVALLATPYRDV